MKKRAAVIAILIIIAVILLLLLKCNKTEQSPVEEQTVKQEKAEHGKGGKNVYSEETFKKGSYLIGIPMHSWQENLYMVDFNYLNTELNSDAKEKGKYKVTSNEGKVYYTDNVFQTREAEKKDIEPGLHVLCIDVVHIISAEDQKKATWKIRRVKNITGEEVEVEFYDSYWSRWKQVKSHLKNIRIPLEKITDERIKKVRR